MQVIAGNWVDYLRKTIQLIGSFFSVLSFLHSQMYAEIHDESAGSLQFLIDFKGMDLWNITVMTVMPNKGLIYIKGYQYVPIQQPIKIQILIRLNTLMSVITPYCALSPQLTDLIPQYFFATRWNLHSLPFLRSFLKTVILARPWLLLLTTTAVIHRHIHLFISKLRKISCPVPCMWSDVQQCKIIKNSRKQVQEITTWHRSCLLPHFAVRILIPDLNTANVALHKEILHKILRSSTTPILPLLKPMAAPAVSSPTAEDHIWWQD